MTIRIETARGEFSAVCGLFLFKEMTKKFQFKHRLKNFLPEVAHRKGNDSIEKFFALAYGFLVGADCLDDMENFAEDRGFTAFCPPVIRACTWAWGSGRRTTA